MLHFLFLSSRRRYYGTDYQKTHQRPWKRNHTFYRNADGNIRSSPIIDSIVWGIAVIEMLIKAFWVFCPKWVSSVLYIGMGWTCVLAFTQILNALSPAAFGWLLAGGIIYTVGGIIYALKLPFFNTRHKNFGSHEIFHLFVMGGSACHFILMYAFIL